MKQNKFIKAINISIFVFGFLAAAQSYGTSKVLSDRVTGVVVPKTKVVRIDMKDCEATLLSTANSTTCKISFPSNDGDNPFNLFASTLMPYIETPTIRAFGALSFNELTVNFHSVQNPGRELIYSDVQEALLKVINYISQNTGGRIPLEIKLRYFSTVGGPK